MYGELAVVVVYARIAAIYLGQNSNSDFRFTRVWSKIQVVSEQYARLTEESFRGCLVVMSMMSGYLVRPARHLFFAGIASAIFIR